MSAVSAALPVRGEPGKLRAIFLALLVHGAFFWLIVAHVSWTSRPTPPVVAELWDKLPPAKAVPQPPPPPPPEPEPVKAEVKPPPPPPEEVKPIPPKPAPDINEKAEKQKREREKKEREKQEKLEKQKASEAKKREEDEARRKAEAEKKRRDDDKRRRDEEIAKREAQKAQEAAMAAQRSEIDRYITQIKSKIRGRANVPDTVTGTPEVHVKIRLLPGGDVLTINITRSSGNPAYDSAIERGIRSAAPLPIPPPSSELFPQFRELNLQIRHER